MRNATFYIVDVFAERKFAGNQLAVVRGAVGFADHEMQALAWEMNYSETTFILSGEPDEAGGYDVRVFIPNTRCRSRGIPRSERRT